MRVSGVSFFCLGVAQQAVDDAQNGILVFLVQVLDLHNPVEHGLVLDLRLLAGLVNQTSGPCRSCWGMSPLIPPRSTPM